MFGRFFNTAEVDQYADWIVGELKKSLPPGFDPKMKNVAERAQKLDERIATRTGEFALTVPLNIYKKARLAARVREGMTAHGYPEPFVNSFSLDLITRIHAAGKQGTR
jgi:hypothetical protein